MDWKRKFGFLMHLAIGQWSWSSRLYFGCLPALARSLPPKRRRQLLNSINTVEWPGIELGPRTVCLGARTAVRLYPHQGEFDFEAVLGGALSYEREVFAWLESRIADYDLIIEIGANVGVFSVFFALAARNAGNKARIFAFEPSRQSYLRLLKNIEANAAAEIQAFNCAVGDSTRLVPFYEPTGHLTNGSLDPSFASKFSASVVMNQTVVISGKLLETLVGPGSRTLIKIDAEGAEAQILRSLENLIRRFRPELLIEVLPDYESELGRLGFLREAGYHFFNVTPEGLIEQAHLEAGKSRDFVLLPELSQRNLIRSTHEVLPSAAGVP